MYLPAFLTVLYCTSWAFVYCTADKARDKRTGELVALKKLRMEREREGELP